MKTWLQLPFVILLFFNVLLPALLQAAPVSAADDKQTNAPEVAIVKIHHRPATELLPQVQTLLSAAGRASVDTITNSVIVSDTPHQVKEIRRLLQRLDLPTPQVTVTLRYHETGSAGRSLSTRTGISGHRKGLHLRSGDFDGQKRLQITISSGSSGYLMVGRNIPFTSYWLDLCSRYGYQFSGLTEYTTIGSGFEVRPLVIGKRVDLTLLPRLSFTEGRTILFTKAATRVTIPTNTWVRLAATDGGLNTVAAAILSANGQNNNRAMVLEVMARVR